MKEEYRKIYNRLHNNYIKNLENPQRLFFREFENEFVQDIDIAINRFLERNSSELPIREDAIFFLMVNFHYMLIKPILEYNKIRAESIFDTLRLGDDIISDVNTVLKLATNRLRNEKTERKEITAHLIMEVIDEQWEELRLTRFEVWND